MCSKNKRMKSTIQFPAISALLEKSFVTGDLSYFSREVKYLARLSLLKLAKSNVSERETSESFFSSQKVDLLPGCKTMTMIAT